MALYLYVEMNLYTCIKFAIYTCMNLYTCIKFTFEFLKILKSQNVKEGAGLYAYRAFGCQLCTR